MKLIDGNAIAAQVRDELREDIEKEGIKPKLTAVLVGNNPASAVYVRNKQKACEEVGIDSEIIKLEDSISEKDLLEIIRGLNEDKKTNGIIVQLPLPEQISENRVIEAIDPLKDVDGFHPINMGFLLAGEPRFVPSTPQGIKELVLRSGYEFDGNHVVIVGRSNIVGKPLAALLLCKDANATVTVCHSHTKGLNEVTKEADILVAAIGRAGFIGEEMVKDGSIVIDVGINRIEDKTRKSGYRLVGDVDFDAVKDKVEAITPVPGGVGPMTVAMLLVNTVKAYKMQCE
ncbi:MAG: bifunctional methylenetetrahydrofolate dehydrogenase/methenyltetrahydrofolate cyclohydrolase FolD [Candidatus Thermoplasmatota archaeon]|nr:bifunctional methylenetetrahydrofolate dehydrogenase/methenyltetrahydrofolate cyclohydrolase FolD [Candidatus Thermoplasmatota archaeon]